MKSSKKWKEYVQAASSATYSINTTGKGIAKAQALGDCASQLRSRLLPNTLYVIQINEEFKENSSAFETGLVSTNLFVWEINEVFRNQLEVEKKNSFLTGIFLTLFSLLALSFLSYLILKG